jgi:hypothetical protein
MGKKAAKNTVAKVADAKRTSSGYNGDKAEKEHKHVITFYGDRPGKKFREFSNYFPVPFAFVLPAFARRDGLPRSSHCEFSEKAVMLTKAALMGDVERFHELERATDPRTCKSLGRGVRNFDDVLWKAHLEETAFEVVKQKFEVSRELRQLLLSTGSKIIAEAAPNDSIWGIGVGCADDRSVNPAQWCGQNILGYALMRVRSHLRGEVVPNMAALASNAGHDGFGWLARLTSTSADSQSVGEQLLNSTMEQPCSTTELQHDDRTSAKATADISVEEETFLRPISDLEAVRACYERYGVVGVTGVLSQAECQALILEGLEPYLPEGCHMNDPESFALADRALNRFGVIGKEALFSESLLSARLHPNVVASYSAVHDREDVIACHDRAAWMRPSLMNPAWDTPFSWPGLHFDVSLRNYFDKDARASVDSFLKAIDFASGNFVAENNAKHFSMGRTVQGVLNLLDNEEEDGGFHCVPGMYGDALKQWVETHESLPAPEVNGRYNLQRFGSDAELGKQAVRLPCPAGTLILFDATLPHGTRPNASWQSRAILFLRYLTSDELPAEAWVERNAALRSIVTKLGVELDDRQKQHLYGPE